MKRMWKWILSGVAATCLSVGSGVAQEKLVVEPKKVGPTTTVPGVITPGVVTPGVITPGPSCPGGNCGSSCFTGCCAPSCVNDCFVPPPMFGDIFFGAYRETASGLLVLPEPGGTSRRTRISENGSPLPQDRVFVNYNYLDSVRNNTNVNHYLFGAEKTFLDGRASVQVMIPFASTLANVQVTNQGLNATDTEFGNISVWLKYLVARSERGALSAGLGVNTPTAEDIQVFNAPGDANPALRIRNDSWLLSPFVGYYLAPSDKLFFQGFTQLDIDLNGNEIEVAGVRTGSIRSATLLYVSGGVGYNLFTSNDGILSRITPMAEIHWTTSLDTTNGAIGLENRANRFDAFNVSTGVALGLGDSANLNLGFAFPLNNDRDQMYDWQLFAQFQLRFGPR